MTKPIVSGEMSKKESKEVKQFKKEMAELKPGDGVQVGDTKYEYGADLNTEGVPLIDPGTGRTISIRTFSFKMNPAAKGVRDFTNTQAIFNSHAQQISTILWGDGLVPLDGHNPRVIINTKGKFYQIFVPCEAKRSTLFLEKPVNLTEQLIHSSKEVSKRKLDKPVKS